MVIILNSVHRHTLLDSVFLVGVMSAVHVSYIWLQQPVFLQQAENMAARKQNWSVSEKISR